MSTGRSASATLVTWTMITGVVVGGAIGQGLLAVPGFGRMPLGGFVLVALASAVLLIAQLAALSILTRRLVARRSREHWLLAVVWSSILVALSGVAMIIFAPSGIVLAAASVFILPAAASGRRHAFAGFVAMRRQPWRSLASW